MKRLENKTALVTGGSRGLGRAIAVRLARDGAFVALNFAGNRPAADEAVAAVEREGGGGAVAVQADLASLDGVRTLFEALDAELGRRFGAPARFDILVNSAGIAAFATTAETDEAMFDRVFALNAKALFFVTQAAIPRLRDGGRIINLGTGLTRLAAPSQPAYSASKGAVDVLTRAWAAELGPRGIAVNTVAPGAIDTDMNAGWLRSEAGRRAMTQGAALGRVGAAEDIADAAAFLASDDSRWITGERIEASGGFMLAPPAAP